jgi:phosphate transport system permease protein
MSVTSPKNVRPMTQTADWGRPRRLGKMTKQDFVLLAGSSVAGLALTWLSYSRLLPFHGLQGFLFVWFVLFLALYYIAVREVDGRVIAKDRMMTAMIAIVAIGIIVPLALIIGYVAWKGLRYLRFSFFTQTMASITPTSPAGHAGGLQSMVGTIEQVGIAVCIGVPLGILTAIYLSEVKGRLRRPVRIFVDAMSGVPSIVAGLFIYAVFVTKTGFSGFAAGLALSILMLPTVTRITEVVLRLVPDGLREASLAMGSPEWQTVWRVVLPTARTGIITAIILGIARVVGETAPLIMTAFGSPLLNANPFQGAQAAMPLTAFRLFTSSQPADVGRAWVFAIVLLMMVLALFVTARRFGKRQFERN